MEVSADPDDASVVNSVVNSEVHGVLVQAGHIDTLTLNVSEHSPWPVPRQLTRDVVDFVGRSDALRRLDELVARDGVPCVAISAVDGIPGVGKTALAVHWAHSVANRFPDGQLLVDMRGHDPDHPPVSPADALDQLLRALGVAAERIPIDTAERAALYRSLLAERRVLVLLDNVRTAGQVRPLVPGGTGSMILVTSRNRLSGLVARDGAVPVALGVLSPDEAVELLAAAVGWARVRAEPAAAAEIARLCGLLPLALRIAAERCASLAGVRLGDVAGELADERSRLDALATGDEDACVRTVFHTSYRALPPESARVFKRLGLHPGPEFSRAAAAAITGDGSGATNRALADLTRAHLVEQVGADRFAFHDLLRDYARELAEAEDSAQDRSNAVRRILNWYLHTTSDASRVVTPARRQAPLPGAEPSTTPLRFSTYDSALHWLDAEQANLAGAIPFAAKTGHHDIGWRLSFALSAYFDLRKRRLLWIESHETALASARATGDAFGEAHLLIDLGLACRNLKRFEDAIGHQRQAITACHRINDRSGEAQTLAGLGDSYRALGRYDEAVSTELEALAACRANGDRYNEAWALTILGQIHREMRRAEEAIAFHEQAAAVHREVSDRYGEAFTLANLAASHQEAGQHADATRRGAEALAGAREVGDEWGTARVLTNLGQLRHDAGDHTDALACWTEAQRLFTATDEDLAGDVAARISRLGTGEAMSNRVI